MADWKVRSNGRDAVLVTVHGDVGVDDAGQAARDVMRHLEQTTEPMHICFDIREINSYSIKAREEWSVLLKQYKKGISALTWVTQKSTHRMVGRAVGLFTGIPTRIVDDMPASLDSMGAS